MLIATGTRARPWVNQEEAVLDGVFTLRTREDSSRLRARLASGPKRVLVIGGGFTGSEVASVCCELGLPVTLAERGPTLLAGALGQAAGTIFARRWQQQQALSQSIPPPATPSPSSYPTDQIFQSQPMETTQSQEQTTTLSQQTRLKIEELKRLLYKYPQYHSSPGVVIACVVHFCNDGDNTFLDEKLEQLRRIDSAMGYPRM